MSTTTVKPWIESVHLHPDVLKDHAGTDIFALDLGPLADNSGDVAPVYRDPESFFQASYVTAGLKGLLDDVLTRLAGKGGAPVLKLMTPFGGGKSHTMAALFHAATNRKALDLLPEAKGLPNPGKVRVAVVDGQFFNAQKGKESDGVRAQTMWGWLGVKLGGKKGYDLVRENDESRVAPGGDELMKLFGDEPNLILLDEVLEYLINAGGVKVIKTDLREQTLNFLKELTVAAANAPRTVVVMALPSSKPNETLQHSQLLSTLDHFVGRKDQLREPVEQDEVFRVIQRRLLDKMPEEKVASETAGAYQQIFTNTRKAYATSEADEQQAGEEGLALRDRIKSAYPFHPALLDLMRQRWASLPEYQRTRGALRFLAVCLRATHKAGKSNGILGPCDVLLSDHDVKRALVKELHLLNHYDAVFEADLIGPNSRARRIDQRRAKENPAEVGKLAATKLASAIFLFSFGGLRRDGGQTQEVLPAGVTEQDLLAACVGPDMDSLTAKACLAELRQSCLYLHFDGVRYCFKKDPNVTLLVEQEADAVARDEKLVNDRIEQLLSLRLGGQHGAIVWPRDSAAMPDKDPRFLVGYLPLDFASKTSKDQDAWALEMFEKCGNTPRSYRNGLALTIPAVDQVEILRREIRYLIAIERVKRNAKKLNLSKEQQDELRERDSTHAGGMESAFLKLYAEVWLPKLNEGKIDLEKISVGNRPLQTMLTPEKAAKVFERTMELLMAVQRKVYDSLSPMKVVDLFKLGEGEPPTLGIRCADVRDGFYSFLGFARLTSERVLRKAIADGISQGIFGYCSGTVPTLGPDGKYQVALSKVRFENLVPESEIDLDSGFLMLPQAVPLPAPAPAVPTVSAVATSATIPAAATMPPPVSPSAIGQPGGVTPVLEKQLELSFIADRTKLFQAWNALANLADLAGQVTVTVRAASPKGFDKAKLQNGVMEPLREADLIE